MNEISLQSQKSLKNQQPAKGSNAHMLVKSNLQVSSVQSKKSAHQERLKSQEKTEGVVTNTSTIEIKQIVVKNPTSKKEGSA